MPHEFLTKTNPVMICAYGEVFNADVEEKDVIPDSEKELVDSLNSMFGHSKY